MNVQAATFNFQATLMPSACPTCGCLHAVPPGMDHWMCPNGHTLSTQAPAEDKRQKIAAKLADHEHVGRGKCPYCKKDFTRLDRHLAWNHLEEQGRAQDS